MIVIEGFCAGMALKNELPSCFREDAENMIMLSSDGVSMHFGGLKAVENVDLEVRRGRSSPS